MLNIIWIVVIGVFGLVVLWIILGKIEGKFRKRFLFIKRKVFYRIRLRKLMESKGEPIRTINSLNEIARDFFAEFFCLDYKIDYSELKEKFERLKNPDSAMFCEQMLLAYYSPEKMTNEKVEVIINLLSKIINETDTTKKENAEKEIMQRYYFPEEEIEKEEINEKIDSLLIEGYKLLSQNNNFMARKIYEKIRRLYPQANLKDKYLRQRIIIFYKKLVPEH